MPRRHLFFCLSRVMLPRDSLAMRFILVLFSHTCVFPWAIGCCCRSSHRLIGSGGAFARFAFASLRVSSFLGKFCLILISVAHLVCSASVLSPHSVPSSFSRSLHFFLSVVATCSSPSFLRFYSFRFRFFVSMSLRCPVILPCARRLWFCTYASVFLHFHSCQSSFLRIFGSWSLLF